MSDEAVLLSRSGEKKIVQLPPVRVEEGMRADLRELAAIKGVSEAELMRMALTKMIDEEVSLYLSLHTIFAGRERRSNESRALRGIADESE
jgi:hypothetical protein